MAERKKLSWGDVSMQAASIAIVLILFSWFFQCNRGHVAEMGKASKCGKAGGRYIDGHCYSVAGVIDLENVE